MAAVGAGREEAAGVVRRGSGFWGLGVWSFGWLDFRKSCFLSNVVYIIVVAIIVTYIDFALLQRGILSISYK